MRETLHAAIRFTHASAFSQEIAKLNEGKDPTGVPRKRLPLALRRYNQNRVLRAAAVQGLSRVSSAFLFQYQPPLDIEWSFPPKFRNSNAPPDWI